MPTFSCRYINTITNYMLRYLEQLFFGVELGRNSRDHVPNYRECLQTEINEVKHALRSQMECMLLSVLLSEHK